MFDFDNFINFIAYLANTLNIGALYENTVFK